MTTNDYRAHMAAIASRIELALLYITLLLLLASSAALFFSQFFR